MDHATAAEMQTLHEQVCKAIADPKRLMILSELRDGRLCVGELCEALDISQSNASQHLAVLRARGMVAGHREGTTVYYALTNDKIVRAIDLLREFLRSRSEPDADLTPVFLG